jgi:hypothetical protein
LTDDSNGCDNTQGADIPDAKFAKTVKG